MQSVYFFNTWKETLEGKIHLLTHLNITDFLCMFYVFYLSAYYFEFVFSLIDDVFPLQINQFSFVMVLEFVYLRIYSIFFLFNIATVNNTILSPFRQKLKTLQTESHIALRAKCPYSELFWSAFSRIRTKYRVSLRIQSECGKIRLRITPNPDTFHPVSLALIKQMQHKKSRSLGW